MTDPFDTTTDVDDTPPTPHFGYTRIGDGEGFDKNGWAFGDADRVKIDAVQWALVNHRHTGTPALGDPSAGPTLAALTTGGHLAPDTTYYYRIAFVDKWGLETAASPEESITTPAAIEAPTAAAARVETADGTLAAGAYSYLLTVLDAYGGETTPSDSTDVSVAAGNTNRIALELPDLPTGGIGFNLYRARPGQTAYYFLATTSDPSWYDPGDPEDQTITAPLNNTTNSNNAVQVSITSGVIPEGCVAWRIYRATESGGYDGDSLVHQVSEGVTESDLTPVTEWVDTGDVQGQGFPLSTSSTIPDAPVIDLDEIQGHLPITALPRGVQVISSYAAGALVDGQLVNVTESAGAVRPTRFTAHFATPPAAGTTVTLHLVDGAGATLDLPCSDAAHRAGDPVGYYRAAWPVTDGGTFEAESGTPSDDATVAVVTDLAAYSGQAVHLATQDEWVEIELGTLDAGLYTSSARLRAVDLLGSSAGDVTIEAIRTDTGATLGSQAYATPTDNLYVTPPGPSFTAPGGAPVVLRVRKSGTTTTTYNIDQITAAPLVPELQAGLLQITADVDAGAGAADANIALWF